MTLYIFTKLVNFDPAMRFYRGFDWLSRVDFRTTSRITSK